MKYLPSTLLLGLLTCTFHAQTPAPTAAADPFVKGTGDATAAGAAGGEVWPDCLVTFEAYALAGNDAVALLQAEQGGGARYRRVLELAKSGKARLEILTALVTKSGQRAVCESNDEVRYATQFASPATAKGLPAPTAWEARNAGDTLEIEPVRGADGLSCDISLVPQHVSLVGFRDVTGMTGDASTSQPVFNSQKLTTATTVKDREPHYLGTFSPPAPQDTPKDGETPEIWLAFLHFSNHGPAAPEGRPPGKTDTEAPVTLEYSCYSLDRTLAREIVIGPASMSAPWEKVKALLAENKARLEHIISIKTKPGQRTVNEEMQEIRYVTGYAPEARVGSSETAAHFTPNGANEKDMTLTGKTITTRVKAGAERIPGYGNTFDTRKVGTSVEAEPVISADGRSVDLNQVVQSIKYLGDLKATGVAAQYPAMPLFEISKVTASQTVPVGARVLVSTLSPPTTDGVNGRADSGRTWLLFIRAAIGEP